jgi:hypothetical protein
MMKFESDDAVFAPLAATSSGPGSVGEVAARLPFAEGRAVATPSSARGEPPLPIGAASSADGREARSPADDTRVCSHEASHATVGRVLGQPIGGATAEPGFGFSGRIWGPKFESRFAADEESAPSLCEKIAGLMPGLGEDRSSIADIVLHCHLRITELTAGTEGERLFCDGEPWFAADDERQARADASLITSSPAAAAALVDACRVEARELLRRHEHVVRALAAELLIRRTLDGDQIDLCIKQAVAAKAMADERARRDDWRFRQESARHFSAVAQPIAKAQSGV